MSFSGTIAKSYFVIAARKFLDESNKPIPYLSCNSIVTYKTFLSQSKFFSNKYFSPPSISILTIIPSSIFFFDNISPNEIDLIPTSFLVGFKLVKI